MRLNRLLNVLLLLVGVVLMERLANSGVQCKRIVFYNPQPPVRTGQLLITQKVGRACPTGQMRDHRGRCRRAIIFSKKRR